MHLRLLAVLLAAALITAGCGESQPAKKEAAQAPGDMPGAKAKAKAAVEDSQKDSDADGILDAYDPEPNIPKKTRAEPEPDGNYKVNCDYLIGDGLDDGYTFVAGGSLKNTGNVGIVTKVKITWPQIGSEPITHEETVRIARGHVEDIKVNMPATSEQIDRLQSAAEECKTNIQIVDTFGKTPLE